MRPYVCEVVAPRLPGRCCPTTLLDMRAPGRDPALRMPRGRLQLWLRCWTSEPSMRAGAARA
eukprot:6970634-Pyramimonas_sp.AAC.1